MTGSPGGSEDVVIFYVAASSFWFKDWRLIWTNKPGKGYCERVEQDSRIHISAEVDKDQITVEDGLTTATFSEIGVGRSRAKRFITAD